MTRVGTLRVRLRRAGRRSADPGPGSAGQGCYLVELYTAPAGPTVASRSYPLNAGVLAQRHAEDLRRCLRRDGAAPEVLDGLQLAAV